MSALKTIKLKFKKGMTLVEVLTTLAITGVFVAVIHTAFVTNWRALDERLARAELWQEANHVIESVTRDARQAQQIDVDAGEEQQTIRLQDALGNEFAVYELSLNGELRASRPHEASRLFSESVDFSNSLFTLQGRALRIQLRLSKPVISRRVDIDAATEIYPRN